MEGLEATEINIHECIENKDFRIDSGFYTKAPLINPQLNYLKIGDCIISSQYGISISMNEDGIGYPIYRMNEIHNMLCDIDVSKCAEITLEELETFKLHDKDILFNRTNSFEWVGRTGIYYQNDNINRVFASYLVRFIPNVKYILPEYLATYLNTKYGIWDIKRRARQSINQTNVNPEEVKEIEIPILPMAFQKQIANNLQLANEKRIIAHNQYIEAEVYLLECLGMTDFAANPDTYNVKTLKESFFETGRFDAEYYLPKYEDYCRLVQSYSNGYEQLGDACNIKDTNYTPEEGMHYKYIELANIGKSGEISGCDIQDGENLPTRARRMVHQGDVIVSSIEGSLESCALVTKDYEGALCSTGFYVLRSSKLNPETLLTLFKSLPIQQLMKKGCSGTILTAISKPELEKLPIPIIRQEVQDKIALHVQKSFALRNEAMQLLEDAKMTIEQTIENGGGNLLIFKQLQNRIIQEIRNARWLLLTEIGILPDIEKESKIVKACKKLSGSFLSSGRLDAEYYQPKYDYLFSRLNEFPISTIGDLTEIYKSIEPGSDAYQETGVPFIRVSDLSKFGLSDAAIHLNAKDYKSVIRPQKNTILLSKDGSVGIAYKVDEPLDVITSGAILHLSIKSTKVLPDYLTLVLNSPIVRLQAERDAGGSIIQHWKPSEIENVIIPILPMPIQQKISEKIQESFKLRKESKELLNNAKQKVEMTIEGIA